MEDGVRVEQSGEEEQLEDYLLPYQEIPREIADPYFFSLNKGKRYIDYFGSHHSYDPQDPMFDQLLQRWNEFKDKTGGRNCFVVIEGGRGARPIAPDPRAAINKYGEKGLMWNLAFRSRIPVSSPEPEPSYEIQQLLASGFSPDEIAYYYLMRMIPQWHQYNPPIEWHTFVESYLKNFDGVEEFHGLDFSSNNITKLHRDLFQGELNLNDGNFFNELIDPARTDNPISRIAGIVAKMRDESVVKYITELWRKRKSVFVVFGSEHAVVQEPALRQLVK